MKSYEIQVCGISRTLPLIPISDQLAFASFVVISDTELISAAAPVLAEKIRQAGAPEEIVTAEAKGIALAYEVSRLLGLKRFVVARKSMKSYMQDAVHHEVKSITTANTQVLYLDGSDAAEIRGRRVCILDDVISTGESIAAVEALVQEAGGIVACRAAILAEGSAASRSDILYLQKLPLFQKDAKGDYLPLAQ
jgi:adenine phosphoribosyltransferase